MTVNVCVGGVGAATVGAVLGSMTVPAWCLSPYLLGDGRVPLRHLGGESTHDDLQVALKRVVAELHGRATHRGQQLAAQGEGASGHLLQLSRPGGHTGGQVLGTHTG